MRVLVIVMLAACWRGGEPAPVQPIPAPEKPAPIADVPMTCDAFDAANPNCNSTCLPGAPDDWPGCVLARDKMIAQGFNCTGPSPRSCTPPLSPPPPPPCTQCPPVKARIIALKVIATGTEITIAAGANHGITRVWTATFLDANNSPVPNGAVAIVRVDQSITVGQVALSAQQVVNLRFVLLAP